MEGFLLLCKCSVMELLTVRKPCIEHPLCCKAPHLVGKSASLGGQSASLGGQSASFGGQSASLGGQSASLGGQTYSLGGQSAPFELFCQTYLSYKIEHGELIKIVKRK